MLIYALRCGNIVVMLSYFRGTNGIGTFIVHALRRCFERLLCCIEFISKTDASVTDEVQAAKYWCKKKETFGILAVAGCVAAFKVA
jgi:hypothetical protein